MTPDSTDADDGVLAPDELQLDDDYVDEIGENRFLVRPDQPNGDSDSTANPAALEAADAPAATDVADAAERNDDHTHARTQHVADATEPHGVDITLKTDGEIAHHHATSHDVREVFVDMLTWYARQLDDDMSPSEALQVMLAASDLEV